jgi:hypothetical protein
VPRAAIRIRLWISLLGERAVRLATVVDVCGEVSRRAHQRVPKPHPLADLDESLGLGVCGDVRGDAHPPRRPDQQRLVSDRLGRRGQQELLRRHRQ